MSCPYKFGYQVQAETLQDHMHACMYQIVPCGAGSKACKRQLRSWLKGDIKNGNASLVWCEPHGETALSYLAANNGSGCNSPLAFLNVAT